MPHGPRVWAARGARARGCCRGEPSAARPAPPQPHPLRQVPQHRRCPGRCHAVQPQRLQHTPLGPLTAGRARQVSSVPPLPPRWPPTAPKHALRRPPGCAAASSQCLPRPSLQRLDRHAEGRAACRAATPAAPDAAARCSGCCAPAHLIMLSCGWDSCAWTYEMQNGGWQAL